MAIGTTVKVGFDGKDVDKGLGGIHGGFAKLGKGLAGMSKQMGVGAARQIGASLFGFVTQTATAIPSRIEELAQLSKEIKNIARDSSMAESEVIALMHAFKSSGMDTDLAGDTLREFATKFGEAVQDFESEPAKALQDLKLPISEINKASLKNQINSFALAVQHYGGSQQKLAFIMDRFLGGDLGLKAIGFFQDYNKHITDGTIATEKFTRQMSEQKTKLEQVSKLRMLFEQKFDELSLAVIGETGGIGQSLSDWLQNMDIESAAKQIASFIRTIKDSTVDLFSIIQGGQFSDTVNNLFRDVGKQIGEGIKDAMPSLGFPSIFGGGKDRSTSQLLNELQKSNGYLASIERTNGTYA